MPLHTSPEAWTDRVTGCLLAGALGDAAGRPFEGSPPVPAGAVADVLAGGELTWTDDTAMMLTLAEHLAELPSWHAFDEGALARAHARAWQAEPWRGYGASPPAIFRAVLAGQDWEAVAAGLFGGEGSVGNGAAMRAAPLGALPAPPETVARLARRAAGVTHTHDEGRDGAVAIAITAHRCLREPAPADPAAAAQPTWAAQLLGEVATQVRSVRMREAVQAVADTLALEDPVDVAGVTSTGITAVEAVPAALAAFLHHPASPVEAVTFAVRMGGDTDTVATMAGALAGARSGAAALPDKLVERIEAAERIRRLGAALAGATLG